MNLDDWVIYKIEGEGMVLDHKHQDDDEGFVVAKVDGVWICEGCLEIAPTPIQHVANLSFCDTSTLAITGINKNKVKEKVKKYNENSKPL